MFAPKTIRAARVLLALTLVSLAPLARAGGHDEEASRTAERGAMRARAGQGHDDAKDPHVTRSELRHVEQALLEKVGASRERRAAEPEFTDRG